MSEEDIKNKLLEQRLMKEKEEEMQKAVKDAIFKILDEKARERLSNIKVVKPELASQLEMYFVQLAGSGQLPKKITDEQLKQILINLTGKKEIKIKRK